MQKGEEDNKEKNNELYELEIEEKKLPLRERSMKLQADEAEIRSTRIGKSSKTKEIRYWIFPNQIYIY